MNDKSSSNKKLFIVEKQSPIINKEYIVINIPFNIESSEHMNVGIIVWEKESNTFHYKIIDDINLDVLCNAMFWVNKDLIKHNVEFLKSSLLSFNNNLDTFFKFVVNRQLRDIGFSNLSFDYDGLLTGKYVGGTRPSASELDNLYQSHISYKFEELLNDK